MPRPGRRAVGLVFGAGVLFLVGTNVQAGWLLVLAAMLLGVVLAGALLPGRMLRGIEVERRAPTHVHQGDDAVVELVVTNRGRGLRAGLELEDAHIAPVRGFVASLRPGERVAVESTRLAARRGVFLTKEITVASAAPFGVARRRRRVPASSTTVVFPRVEALGSLEMLEAFTTFDHTDVTHARRGAGREYLGIREYRPGDSMRHVHWPSTARTGSVMVREFEQERVRRMGIVVDAFADAGEGERVLDACCTAAASIALAAQAEGHAVQLATVRDGGVVDTLRDPDRFELLTWLAELDPTGVRLPPALAEVSGALRGSETVLVVAPTWLANGGLAEAAGDLQLSGREVVAALVDVPSFEPRGARGRALTGREAEALAEAFDERGIRVYRIGAGETLAACLLEPVLA